MKVPMLARPAVLLCAVAALSACAEARKAAAREEFIGKCVSQLTNVGQSKATSKAICNCTMDRGEAFRERDPEGMPSKQDLAAYLIQCGREQGVELEG